MRFVPSLGADRKIADAVKPGTKDMADAIASRVRFNMPVQTGKARDSVRVEETDDGHKVVAGGGDAFYVKFLEFGTSDTPTFAPLRRAAESVGKFRRNR